MAFGMESDCGAVGPIGIAEQFASQQYQIGIPIDDGLIGLVGVGDEPADGGGDVDCAANLACHRDQEAFAPGDFGDVGGNEAMADIDEIESGMFESRDKFDGFVERDTLFVPIGHRESSGERQVLGPDLADGVKGFHDEADTILEGATVVVVALIGEG